jgi:preprotein translocase subunit SecG
MSLPLKVGLIVLAAIFVALAIFLVIGNVQGDNDTDKNNSHLKNNTSKSR